MFGAEAGGDGAGKTLQGGDAEIGGDGLVAGVHHGPADNRVADDGSQDFGGGLEFRADGAGLHIHQGVNADHDFGYAADLGRQVVIVGAAGADDGQFQALTLQQFASVHQRLQAAAGFHCQLGPVG